MNVYIMTKGRVGNQESVKWIPPAWDDRFYIVCPPEEVDRHRVNHPNIGVIDEPQPMNYSEKFQFLLEVIKDDGGKGVIMDDDLWFDKRPTEADGLQRITNINDLDLMWRTMEAQLDFMPLVGVHPRMMGHQAPWPFKDVGKIITVQGVNLNLFPSDIPTVSYDPILADVHLNCYLLSRGYPNRLISRFVVNWKASQAPGGCDYRTPDMQMRACMRVEEMYSPYATMVKKRPKSAKWLGDWRYDLRVQWKKMWEDAPNVGR